jgi:hypothetical protein
MRNSCSSLAFSARNALIVAFAFASFAASSIGVDPRSHVSDPRPHLAPELAREADPLDADGVGFARSSTPSGQQRVELRIPRTLWRPN